MPLTIIVLVLLIILIGFLAKYVMIMSKGPSIPPVNAQALSGMQSKNEVEELESDAPKDTSKKALIIEAQLKGADMIYTYENLSLETLGIEVDSRKIGLRPGDKNSLKVTPGKAVRLRYLVHDAKAMDWKPMHESMMMLREGRTEVEFIRSPTTGRLRFKSSRIDKP